MKAKQQKQELVKVLREIEKLSELYKRRDNLAAALHVHGEDIFVHDGATVIIDDLFGKQDTVFKTTSICRYKATMTDLKKKGKRK